MAEVFWGFPRVLYTSRLSLNRPQKQPLCFHIVHVLIRPPLWSSGQSFWLQIQRSWVHSPALPDFLSSSGSGTGSTQPREPREVN